jgi:hypothetical protein
LGQDGLHNRDIESGQQGFRFHFCQHFAPLGQDAFDQDVRTCQIRIGKLRQRRGRLLQQLLDLVERSDVAEGIDRRLG